MHTFVSRDPVVGRGESGKESSFPEPEDGAETAAEEYALDHSEGNQALDKLILLVDPAKRPLCLFLYRGYGLYGIE